MRPAVEFMSRLEGLVILENFVELGRQLILRMWKNLDQPPEPRRHERGLGSTTRVRVSSWRVNLSDLFSTVLRGNKVLQNFGFGGTRSSCKDEV